MASLTGVTILALLLVTTVPRTLHSYFSSVVRARVGGFSVQDFQAPAVTVTLQQGQTIFYGPTLVTEPADPVDITGSAVHTLASFSRENQPQMLELSLQFLGEIGQYQSKPCLEFFLDEMLLYTVLCQNVTDSDDHKLFLPASQIADTHFQHLIVHTHLPDNMSTRISSTQDGTWVLTPDTKLSVHVDDANKVMLSSSAGVFVEVDSVFVLQQESLPENKKIVLTLDIQDDQGNNTRLQQHVYRPTAPHVSTIPTVKYFLENEEGYHALVNIHNQFAWYVPLFIKNADSSIIFSRYIENSIWHPLTRYQEPESLVTKIKQLQLYDSFLQPYTLIETQ